MGAVNISRQENENKKINLAAPLATDGAPAKSRTGIHAILRLLVTAYKALTRERIRRFYYTNEKAIYRADHTAHKHFSGNDIYRQ